MRLQLSFLNLLILLYAAIADETKPKQKPWKNKDIRDMTEAELEHIYDEWEENDEPLEPDELPEHLRPSLPINLSKIDASNPDEILKMTKRGKSVMMFVDLDPEISEEQAENVIRIWHSGMRNNHIIAERYPIEPRRSIFLFREGSQVIDAKEFLLEQPELSHLTLEGQTYYNKQKSKPEKKPENQSGKTTKKQKKSEL